MRRFFPRISLLLPPLLLLSASCGDSTKPAVPARLEISPKALTMNELGLRQQYTAIVEDEDGNEMDGVKVAWSISNPEVGSVSASGLVTGLGKGTATVSATAEGLSGQGTLTVNPLPTQLLKSAGDEQIGILNRPLPLHTEVEVKDAGGNPLAGVTVYFSVSAGKGSVSPSSLESNSEGKASVAWTLGCSDESSQRLTASAGALTVVFTATPNLSFPVICQSSIPNGRATLPYSSRIQVTGPDPAEVIWSLESGELPQGLGLSENGLLGGTPTRPGSFSFQVQVRNATGESDSVDFELRVCEAPLALAPGEAISLQPTGTDGCGFFLLSGIEGDRYRLGMVWPSFDEDAWVNLPSVTVKAERVDSLAAGPTPAPRRIIDTHRDPRDLIAGMPEPLQKTLVNQLATEEFHRRLRAAERKMIRELGSRGRPLPERGSRSSASGPQESAPDKLTLFYPDYPVPTCSFTERVTALKIAENEDMVIYQDSTQSAIDSLAVTPTMAQMMLDYYRDYGKEVIETYFGGVSDINGDGRVVVLVTPAVVIGVAFVWSGDFLPTNSCASSNQMELVRFDASTVRGLEEGDYHALATLVHEVKHISSLYKSLVRSGDFSLSAELQPDWVEEGGAEIAAEMSSRLAWEAGGGPAVGETVNGEARLLAYDADGELTPEAFGLSVLWGRAALSLGSQPNALVNTPNGAQAGHSVYGSGWHFHRWLGDAYGDAKTRLADGPFFSSQVDPSVASGAQGIQDLTGVSWADLMEEYLSAVMRNRTQASKGEKTFTSYNFPEVTEGLEEDRRPGPYPWPVNVNEGAETAPFESFINTGSIGASGLRILDLTSDGGGMGLDLTIDVTGGPLRIVLVRLK